MKYLPRLSFLPWLWLAIPGLAAAPSPPRGTLQATIVDASTRQPLPCTVQVTDATGQIVTRTAAFRDGFRCSGSFKVELPPGLTRVRFTRGFEYGAAERTLTILPDQTRTLSMALARNVDLRAHGWFAGDSHAHMLHGERTLPVDFDFVALTAAAEDLHYLSLAQAWTLDDPTPENLERELSARSRPDCRLTWNLEAPKNYYRGDARRCLGHAWNIGLRGRTPDGTDVIQSLLAASAHDYESTKPTFANFESFALIHAQGGAAFYTHPARWWTGTWGGRGGYPEITNARISNLAVELPLDLVVGPTFDGLDVITTGGESTANDRAFALWCLLLDHGYRLAPTGSSDACFDRVGGAVPGTARVYTHLPQGFSFPAVTAGLAAGHNVVTTGPLLIPMLDQQPPGSVVAADGRPRTLSIEAWASGADSRGLSRLEILRQGRPFGDPILLSAVRHTNLTVTLQESSNTWYCVRLFGSDPARQRAISGAFHFASGPPTLPTPHPATVLAEIVDAASGTRLAATLTEVRFEGPLPRTVRRHAAPIGALTLKIPATHRLQAEAPGYQPTVLSPFLDHPELLDLITRLSAEDLLEWKTYERVRAQLDAVPLKFRLERAPPEPGGPPGNI